MATVGQIWDDHEVQMKLLLKGSYLSVGNYAVSTDLLSFNELTRTQNKTEALTIEERTQELMYGIIATVQSRETDVARQNDFDTFLSILSTEPVFDTLRKELRKVKGKQVEIRLYNYVYLYIRANLVTHGTVRVYTYWSHRNSSANVSKRVRYTQTKILKMLQ